MTTSRRIIATLAAALGVAAAVRLVAQSSDVRPEWETLVRAPLPDGIEPSISVNGLTMPAQPVAEHSHAGPTIGYIVHGEIENQVEPDPLAKYKPGTFFSEGPRQLHKVMRTLSAEPAQLVIFHAGRTGVPASLLKPLPSAPAKLSFADQTQWQVALSSTTKQELRLVRLTLPVGGRTEVVAHSGPGLVYVLEGTVTIAGAGPQILSYGAGDLFLDPANREGLIYRNLTGKEPAKLLMYHVTDPRSAVTTPPMMPYVAVHDPVFVPASDAAFAQDDDLVIGVAQGKTAKAYMALHLGQVGSVDDQMADGPIEVTWCSACGTGAVFRAELNGRRLHFEYDSMMNGNEVHKDVETGSRWQQSTGEAISGPLKGSRLTLYPFLFSTWKAWRTRYPNTTILKPMPGYAERLPVLRPRQRQNLRSGEGEAPAGAFGTDTRLRPREMIAGLAVGDETMAFPISALRAARVVNERLGGVPIVVVHQPSSETTTAFDARAKGKVLRFQPADADAATLIDLETRSTWDNYGLCLRGPLKGTQLKSLILIPEFWFAWSQFRPGTRLFMPNQPPSPARKETRADPLPRRGWLGVALAPHDGGSVVTGVAPGSPAAVDGMRTGDVIRAVDGVAVRVPADVIAAVARHVSGSTATFDLLRAGEELRRSVTLSALPIETLPGVSFEYGSVTVSDGSRLRTIVSIPAGTQRRSPAVMLLQGGGCGSIDIPMAPDAGTAGNIRAIAAQGYVTMRVEKSGVGDSQGPPCEQIGYQQELEGYQVAFAALRKDPRINPDRIGLLGISLGGVFAPLLAAQTPVRGVVVYGTPVWAPSPYPGRSERFFREFAGVDVEAAWSAVDARVLAIHGEFDENTYGKDHARIAELVNATHPGRAVSRELSGLDHCGTQHTTMDEAKGHCGMGRPVSTLNDAILAFVRDNI